MRLSRNSPLARKLRKQHGIKAPSKMGNTRTELGGRRFDSRFEADVAAHLQLWQQAGVIRDVDYQFRVDMTAYDAAGEPVLHKSHKVDFRVHHLSGLYQLVEAKGFETKDWRDRRRWLEGLWLPEHPDHSYVVVKDLPQLNRLVIPAIGKP